MVCYASVCSIVVSFGFYYCTAFGSLGRKLKYDVLVGDNVTRGCVCVNVTYGCAM
jgi:hypothetical protein